MEHSAGRKEMKEGIRRKEIRFNDENGDNKKGTIRTSFRKNEKK